MTNGWQKIRKRKRGFSVPEYQEGVKVATKVGLDFSLEFFATNQAAMLYICETGDGKQGMRSRLFTYWFSTYEYNSKYSLHTTCINDEEGIPNFAALVIRNDNPHIVEIVCEFVETAKALQQKP